MESKPAKYQTELNENLKKKKNAEERNHRSTIDAVPTRSHFTPWAAVTHIDSFITVTEAHVSLTGLYDRVCIVNQSRVIAPP